MTAMEQVPICMPSHISGSEPSWLLAYSFTVMRPFVFSSTTSLKRRAVTW